MQGKVVAIAGGTSGIGLAAAQACLEHGAKLVLCGRDDEHVQKARQLLGDSVLVVTGDVRDAALAQDTIKQAVERFGSLDALFHVAGGSGRRFGDGPLHEATDDGWRETLALNLDSVFFSNRAAIQQFLKQETGGVILNTGSVLGWSPAPHYFATHAYATAKAALAGLTRTTAAYYAQSQIRINLLAPALVASPMSERALHQDEIMTYIQQKQPIGPGIIEPDDLIGAVLYLLSDASKRVTGQVITVDAGWCVSEGETG